MDFSTQKCAGVRSSWLMVLLAVLVSACASDKPVSETERITDFAIQYTAAWCSDRPASVASFFSEDGSLTINDGSPAVGRPAITVAVRSFMAALPDLKVKMDGLVMNGDRVTYRWTLTGTNTGPGGSGNRVRISGYEEWRFGPDQHIAESKGHFDAADYQRQLKGGTAGA